MKKWSEKWKVTFNPSKTEILFISNRPNESIQLKFGDTLISSINEHTHLGITFMSNGKWSSHINNICNSAYIRINFLRKVKYQLSRASLSKIYTTFILPILEYACELWDGCTLHDSDKIERVQLEAARLVTGLPIYASRHSLYLETGWEPLEERRKRRKLNIFYKIHNNLTPNYLNEIIEPFKIQGRNLRTNRDYYLPIYRLSSTSKSFFPSTVKLWNNLDPSIRQIPSFEKFKHHLAHSKSSEKFPDYFHCGNRKSDIHMTRLRHKCSELKADLFRVNLIDDDMCNCGLGIEDTTHFLFHCPRYNIQRITMFNNLISFQPLSLNKLLFGDQSLSISENSQIFQNVQKFIVSTKRF